MIDGVPVAQSVFGRDPFNPVAESDVRKLVASQTDTPVTCDERCGKGILIVDAQSDEDLRTAGERLFTKGYLSVSAGCAGFAAFLPDLLGLDRGEVPDSYDLGDGLLVISGSLNPVTMRQIRFAQKRGFVRICPKPGQEELFRNGAVQSGENPASLRCAGSSAAQRCAGISATQSAGSSATPWFGEKWVILDSSEIDSGEEAFRGYMRGKGMDSGETRVLIAAYLAEILAEIEDSVEGTVMIVGGDTLLSCLRRLGCRDLEPLAELFPGVVLSRYRAGGKEKLLISKSGGFGKESLLADLQEMMKAARSREESREDSRGELREDPREESRENPRGCGQ